MSQLKIEADVVEGFQLKLKSGQTMVFLAQGDVWNGLRRYAAVGSHETMIVLEQSTTTQLIDRMFGSPLEISVVLASPELLAALREVT